MSKVVYMYTYRYIYTLVCLIKYELTGFIKIHSRSAHVSSISTQRKKKTENIVVVFLAISMSHQTRRIVTLFHHMIIKTNKQHIVN